MVHLKAEAVLYILLVLADSCRLSSIIYWINGGLRLPGLTIVSLNIESQSNTLMNKLMYKRDKSVGTVHSNASYVLFTSVYSQLVSNV